MTRGVKSILAPGQEVSFHIMVPVLTPGKLHNYRSTVTIGGVGFKR